MLGDLRLTNEELMLMVRKGDTRAFEVLYGRLHRQVFSFILRLVKERPLAEDILQETFLRVFRERKRYRKTARFSTYLFTIARNLCLDALKRWQRKRILPVQENHLQGAVDLSKGPSNHVEEGQISEIVRREIQALPEDQREVLLLSKYSGRSYNEIAQIVGSTPDAVKQRVYRAMVTLREKLKKLAE